MTSEELSTDPEPNDHEAIGAEVGFTTPELGHTAISGTVETTSEHQSTFGQIKRDGKKLWHVISHADRGDIARGINPF